MEKNKVTKTNLPIFFIILSIIIIIVLGLFIYKINNNNKPTEIQEHTELSQESVEIISEEKMLQLFSESSDMRVTSINQISDNKFSIDVNYYTRVRISKSEYETMKQTGNIIIDDIIYEYKTNNEYSLGTIKSTQDTSKEYYVEEILGEYEFQNVNNEGYDLPLTEFNKEFQYEVNQNYMISIHDLNGTILSYTTLKDVDSTWINSPLENMQVNISRGPQGVGSEIVATK